MTVSRKKLSIAIVGYGIAGIAAAIFLRRQGHDITHFEQAEEPAFVGSGLLLQPAGLTVLKKLHLQDAAFSLGTPITRLIAENIQGQTIMDLAYNDSGYALGLQRGALFGLLRSRDTDFGSLRTSSKIAAVDTAGGYLLDARGRATGPFDVIVAADGAHSNLRAALSSLVQKDRSYRWGALLCLLDDAGKIFTGRVMQRFSGIHHVSVWPVGTLQTGASHRINVSWRTSITEQEVCRTDGIEKWKEQVSLLCPQLAPLLDQITSMDQLLSARYRHVQLRRYYRGRVVFLGDAAHCMSPQLGLGASMALLDAHALAQALDRHADIGMAFACFDKCRRRLVAASQFVSRAVTPLFQSDSPVMAAVRDRTFHPLSRLPFAGRTIMAVLDGQRHLSRALTAQPETS